MYAPPLTRLSRRPFILVALQVQLSKPRSVSEPDSSLELTAISIVLVHGLWGEATSTWTFAPTTSWPKDFLPVYPGFDTAGIRVLSFGYDGMPHDPPPPAPGLTASNISDISDDFLATLATERRGVDSVSMFRRGDLQNCDTNHLTPDSSYHLRWSWAWRVDH